MLFYIIVGDRVVLVLGTYIQYHCSIIDADHLPEVNPFALAVPSGYVARQMFDPYSKGAANHVWLTLTRETVYPSRAEPARPKTGTRHYPAKGSE
jgi:hypothetical protein